MDNDLIFQQFDEIEQRIARLLECIKALEAHNSQLKSMLSKLEDEIKAKDEAEKKHTEEKAFVRARIDALVAKLKDVSEL